LFILILTVYWFATGGVPESWQHLLSQECQISDHNGAEYAELPITAIALRLSPVTFLSLACVVLHCSCFMNLLWVTEQLDQAKARLSKLNQT